MDDFDDRRDRLSSPSFFIGLVLALALGAALWLLVIWAALSIINLFF